MAEGVHAHADGDPACAVAHGAGPTPDEIAHGAVPSGRGEDRVLVAVFAGAVSGFLLRYAADAGYLGVLVEPDEARAAAARAAGFAVTGEVPGDLDDRADVVVTDHHRDELGVALRDALATKAPWVGIMGNPPPEGPPPAALAAPGVPPPEG